MVNRLLILFALIGCMAFGRANAAVCSIANGSGTSTIQSAITSAVNGGCTGTFNYGSRNSGGTQTFTGGVVQLVAGSYNVTQLTIPCATQPIALVGPANNYPDTWTARPTAALVSAYGNVETPPLIAIAANCPKNPGVTIMYLEVNGTQPMSGGGSVYTAQGNLSNLTIEYNYFHGNQVIYPTVCGTDCVNYDDTNATLIYLDGYNGSTQEGTVLTNTNIKYNILGYNGNGNYNAGDCSNVMTWIGTCTNTSTGDKCNFAGYDSNGGTCAGLGVHTSTTNLNFSYNIIQQAEQGTKWYEGGDGNPIGTLYFQTNDVFEYNDIANYHRIGTEDQHAAAIYPSNTSCSGQPNNACMQGKYNDMHDPVNPGFGTWGFSLPAIGWHDQTDNLMISNTNTNGGAGPGDFEFWGYGVNNNNLEQGYISCGHDFGYGQPSQINNNIHQLKVANCSVTNSSGVTTQMIQPEFTPAEGLVVANYPTFSGNTYTTTPTTFQSVAPTISPFGGSSSGPVTVTLTDLGNVSGVGPRGNTGIWCTQDGSNPAPKSGTSQYYSSGATLVLNSTTTLTCVGMWGAITQPASYPAGYGYVPSSPVKAVFTIGGGPGVTNPPSISPAGPYTFSTPLTVTVTPNTSGATTYCTLDGSTPTTSSPVYTTPYTLTSTTTVNCLSTSSGNTNSTVVTDTYTYSLYLGNPLQNVNGNTYENAGNAVYAVTGSAPGYMVNSATLCIPTGTIVTNGASTDVIVSRALSGTTQNTAPLCYGTYTNTSAAGPGCVTIPLTGCGTLLTSTPYWIQAVTNDPLGPSPMGFWNCGSTCGSSLPTTGNGTYQGYFDSVTYGGPYTLPGTLSTSTGQSQPSVSLNLSPTSQPMAATPLISPATTTFATTETWAATDSTPGSNIHCTQDGSTPTSSSPLYTGAVTISATTTVQCVAVATGYINSAIATATYTKTSPTIAYVYILTGLNYMLAGTTTQFTAVFSYTDGVQTSNTASTVPDTRGNYVTWSKSGCSNSVGTINSNGLFSGIAVGPPCSVEGMATGGQAGYWYQSVVPSIKSSLTGAGLKGGGIS